MSDDRLFTRPFLIAFVACFVQAMAFHMYVHLPGFLSELGANEVTIGMIIASASISAILARPIMGKMMDTRGRRVVILIGGGLNTIALALYLTVDSVGPWVYCVRITQGIAQAMLFSAFFTFAADAIPESRRIQGIGIFGISGMLPVGLGPALGDWVLGHGGFSEFFQVSVLLSVLSLLLSLGIHDLRIHRASEVPARPFFATVTQPSLVPLWFIGAAFTTASTSAFVFLKTYVIDAELDGMASYFLAYSLAAITLRIFAGWLPDRVGQKVVFLPSLVVLGLGLYLIPFAHDAKGLILAGLACGIGHGFCMPILTGLVVSRARDSERGAAMSMSTAIFDIGFLFGGPVWGFVILSQGYAAMYTFAMLLTVPSAVIFGVWDRHNTGARELAHDP